MRTLFFSAMMAVAMFAAANTSWPVNTDPAWPVNVDPAWPKWPVSVDPAWPVF